MRNQWKSEKKPDVRTSRRKDPFLSAARNSESDTLLCASLPEYMHRLITFLCRFFASSDGKRGKCSMEKNKSDGVFLIYLQT